MPSEDNMLTRTIGEIASLKSSVDGDSFREVYWNPRDDAGGQQVGVVVARGKNAVATIREAMMMLRDDGTVASNVEIVTDGIPTQAKLPTSPDAPHSDMSHQRNEDLDIVLQCLSDIVRSYPDSPDEQQAKGTFLATCSAQEEMSAKTLAAVLALMMSSGDVSMENVARYLRARRKVAWYLRQLVAELERIQ